MYNRDPARTATITALPTSATSLPRCLRICLTMASGARLYTRMRRGDARPAVDRLIGLRWYDPGS